MQKKILIYSLILFSSVLFAHNAEMLVNVQDGRVTTVRLYKVNNWWNSVYREGTSTSYEGYNAHCDVLPSYDDHYKGYAIWEPIDHSTRYYLRVDNKYVEFYVNYYSSGSGDGDFYITYNGWNFILDKNNR